MLLAIDCGNTNVVFAVYDGYRLLGQWRAATKTDRTSDEYGIWLLELLERDGLKPERITHAIVAVFPVPVAPRRVCPRFPARSDSASCAIALGWSPVGR